MHLSTIASALVLAAAAVNAAPNAAANGHVQERVAEIITLFSQQCYQGTPYRTTQNTGDCVELRTDMGGTFADEFNNKTQSGKAAPGTQCKLYLDSGCKGHEFAILEDGEPKLGGDLAKQASSWRCLQSTFRFCMAELEQQWAIYWMQVGNWRRGFDYFVISVPD